MNADKQIAKEPCFRGCDDGQRRHETLEVLYLRSSAFICGFKAFWTHHSLTPNFFPSHCASITNTKSAMMKSTPSAESSTYCPFSQSSQITIDTTSVPGLYSRIEDESSRIETIIT